MVGSGVSLESAREILTAASAVQRLETDAPDRQIEGKARRRHRVPKNGQGEPQSPEPVDAPEHQLDDLA